MSLNHFTFENHVSFSCIDLCVGISCLESMYHLFSETHILIYFSPHIHSTLRLLLCREIHKPLCNLFLCQAQPNFLPCVFPSAVSLWEGGGSCQGHHHRSRRPSGEQSFSNSTLSVNGIDAVDEIIPPFGGEINSSALRLLVCNSFDSFAAEICFLLLSWLR